MSKAKQAIDRDRLANLIRNFNQNGMLYLMENPLNVRDLLRLLKSPHAERIDFEKMLKIDTSFISRDFRHLESDLILRAPYTMSGSRKSSVLIYLLLEHQSEPDQLMPLRLLDYLVQVYKQQVRDWSKEHSSLKNLRLDPVVPIVFYTGSRTWETPGSLVDLLKLSDPFRSVTPHFEPLFLDLHVLSDSELTTNGGFLSGVLRLFRDRFATPEEFRVEFIQELRRFSPMPKPEHFRWLEFLNYLYALVYHARDREEAQILQELIEREAIPEIPEGTIMAKQTMAEYVEEESETRHLKEYLARILSNRFGELSSEVNAKIEAINDLSHLQKLFDDATEVSSISELQFNPAKKGKKK